MRKELPSFGSWGYKAGGHRTRKGNVVVSCVYVCYDCTVYTHTHILGCVSFVKSYIDGFDRSSSSLNDNNCQEGFLEDIDLMRYRKREEITDWNRLFAIWNCIGYFIIILLLVSRMISNVDAYGIFCFLYFIWFYFIIC